MNAKRNPIYPKFSSEPLWRWPHDGARQLADMLVLLLRQDCCQSLERLQLVAMGFSRKASVQAGVEMVQRGDFLELCGPLDGDGQDLSCHVKYFVRGARKFYRMQEPALEGAARSALPPISADDIRDYFAALLQPNSLLHDAQLSQLLGKNLTVPSQMLAALLIELALDRACDGASFELTFHRVVKADEPLSVAFTMDDQQCTVALNTEHGVAVVLVVRADCGGLDPQSHVAQI